MNRQMYVYLSSHHSPFSGVIESLQELDGSALSTATAPHQSQSLSLLHLQIQPLEDGNIGARGVVKSNALKTHVTFKMVLGRHRRVSC